MNTPLVLLILLVVASTSLAQGSGTASRITMPVVNEDQGKACMIVGDPLSLLDKGSAVVTEPRQFSLFLGNGWASERTQARKNDLANVFGDPSNVDPGILSKLGWGNIYGPKMYSEHLMAETDPVSDLKIQSILTGVVKNDPRLTSPADFIYVIYLGPGLSPRLGALVGSKRYPAYYNAVNTSGTRLRYVVVSYENNPKTMMTNALSGVIAIVFQPACS